MLGSQRLFRRLWPAADARSWIAPGATALATDSAPHIRDGFSFDKAMRCMIVALAPCIAMAFYNTGFQANVNVAVAGVNTAPGWRGAVLDWLGIGYDLASFWSAVMHGALYFVPVLAIAVCVGGLWQVLFAGMRNRPLSKGFLVIALLFALSLPPSIPLWKVALGITFAIVVGREIFGGTGRNFLNPALTGLVFLYVTYPKDMVGETAWTVVDAFTTPTYLQLAERKGPETVAWLGTSWMQTFVGLSPGAMGTTSTLACLLGGVFLLYNRLISGRIVAGVLFGMIATALAVNQLSIPDNPFVTLSWHWHLTLGSFAFGMVFLATDPVTSAMTDKGRWIYGLLIGILVVLIRVANPAHPDGIMFAVLLGNIFAPLIDHMVVWTNISRRERRNG
jgi:Na+-transporting NADH:ubiquinone oxidoreductase subunit B